MRAYEFLYEAGLKSDDLGKRNGWSTLFNKINKNELFTKAGDETCDKDGNTLENPTIQLIPLEKTNYWAEKHKDSGDLPRATVQDYTDFVNSKQKFDAIINGNETKVALSQLYKGKDFGSTGSKKCNSEEQEHGLIDIINKYAKTGIYIPEMKITATLARGNEGANALGKEKYIDIFITDSNGKDHGISMKGDVAMTVGGGGTAGLYSISEKMVKSVYNTLEDFIVNGMGLNDEDAVDHIDVPDMYIPVPDEMIIPIIKGSKAMGGPIDWMYVGPKNITHTIDTIDGVPSLNLNGGKFSTVEDFKASQTKKFYFRGRQRNVDGDVTEIDLATQDKFGLPILMKNESNNSKTLRVVVTVDAPKEAVSGDNWASNNDRYKSARPNWKSGQSQVKAVILELK